MTYDCDKYLIVDDVQTYVCTELPADSAVSESHNFEITQAQANELIIYAAVCFSIVFVVRSIRSLLF